ncbi:MAG: cell division protein ZapB [Candidatus Tectomicrobia bacterium]|nr:cell division protein ZapB [Candidatus Tectomicrobia bacterium]
MPYEKLKLLEAKIAEATQLMERLRREKEGLATRSAELQEELARRQAELEQVRQESAEFLPQLDDLLTRLEGLTEEVEEEQPAGRAPHVEASSAAPRRQPGEAEATPAPPLLGAVEPWGTEGDAEEEGASRRAREPHLEHYDRGVQLEREGRYEEAIAAYRKALTTAPEFVDALEHLAFLLEKLNREEEASPLWAKVLALKKTK